MNSNIVVPPKLQLMQIIIMVNFRGYKIFKSLRSGFIEKLL